MGVYLHTNEWLPWENTLVYAPFKNDLLDHSWNGISLTAKGTPTLSTYSGVNCAYLWQLTALYTASLTLSEYTMSVWVSQQWGIGSEYIILAQWKHANTWNWVRWWLYQNKFTASIVFVGYSTQYTVNYSWWHLVTFTRSWSSFKMYWDGEYKWTYNINYTMENIFQINDWYDFDNTSNQWKGYYSNWIVENKVRTAEEISNYYNSTKSNYWL